MSSQPGCGCSICDEDQESSVPENANRISTQSDPHIRAIYEGMYE
jgi:hypothetical protein